VRTFGAVLVLSLFAGCEAEMAPSMNFTKNVMFDDALRLNDYSDSGFVVVLPSRFDHSECQFGVVPSGDGCRVQFWQEMDGGLEWLSRTVRCSERFWVCSRPYECPCPFSNRAIDTIGPPGKRWYERLLGR
jgi:hypothetical protein